LKQRTGNNVHDTFVGEAKAYQRLLRFARKAADERSH
jgi:rubrerythrin